jgi:hypothetical protein
MSLKWSLLKRIVAKDELKNSSDIEFTMFETRRREIKTQRCLLPKKKVQAFHRDNKN